MLKVAVIGAKGRMGATVCEAVTKATGMELVSALDQGDELTAVTLCGAEVAVDFTIPAVAEANVHALLDVGLHVVVGTTGWDNAALERVREHVEQCPGQGVLIAPNFALSAVLAMNFAAQAARFFESAEIIELHHPNKVDAPSGTAKTTAQVIAQARAQAGVGPIPDATTLDPDGARGAAIDGIHVHAVRLRGMTAHEEILFGNPGESLTIRTDCYDRESFMPGVILAVRKISDRPGLSYGLETVLELN